MDDIVASLALHAVLEPVLKEVSVELLVKNKALNHMKYIWFPFFKTIKTVS